MFNLGFTEMIILGVIILVFVGPNELPELARMVGRFLNEFRRSTDALKEEWHRSTDDISPRKFIGELNEDINKTIGGSSDAGSGPHAPEPPAAPLPEPAEIEAAHAEETVVDQPEEPAATGPSYPPDGKYTR